MIIGPQKEGREEAVAHAHVDSIVMWKQHCIDGNLVNDGEAGGKVGVWKKKTILVETP